MREGVYNLTCTLLYTMHREMEIHKLGTSSSKSRQSPRLSLLKNITKEHLQLDLYSRMRVNLAAQVGILLTAFSKHFIAAWLFQRF